MKKIASISISTVTAFCLIPGLALAQPATATTTVETEPAVSLTFSPLHLIFPIIEITGEARLAEKLGLAGIVGAGTLYLNSTRFAVYEAGAQLIFYPIGSFAHGMQLGVEALWAGVSGSNIAGTGVFGQGLGLGVGPFLGYKIAADVGFTFQIQAGAQMALAHATAGGREATDAKLIPLINLNLGWSF